MYRRNLFCCSSLRSTVPFLLITTDHGLLIATSVLCKARLSLREIQRPGFSKHNEWQFVIKVRADYYHFQTKQWNYHLKHSIPQIISPEIPWKRLKFSDVFLYIHFKLNDGQNYIYHLWNHGYPGPFSRAFRHFNGTLGLSENSRIDTMNCHSLVINVIWHDW